MSMYSYQFGSDTAHIYHDITFCGEQKTKWSHFGEVSKFKFNLSIEYRQKLKS
jgi:hypothetical protein